MYSYSLIEITLRVTQRQASAHVTEADTGAARIRARQAGALLRVNRAKVDTHTTHSGSGHYLLSLGRAQSARTGTGSAGQRPALSSTVTLSGFKEPTLSTAVEAPTNARALFPLSLM